jgi:molybdopterin-dependent oxidoreductase alpha subunit
MAAEVPPDGEGRVAKGRWDPALWVSRKPFGIGEQRPNNFLEILKAVEENRDELAFAWRILNEGVCDGCALGTTGMKDWTLDGPHLCNVRLRLLRLNTMPALDPSLLADAASLRGRRGDELRSMGRIPYPMLRRRGEAGFRRIGWDDALGLAAERISATTPDRTAFYLTSRGMPNESYYAAAKAVRAMGTNSIDNSARVCHAPSTFGLKSALGVAATTCSYTDWIGSDLVVFIGSNIANNQPVATKYLYHAKRAGTKVVVVNTYREPGMERYWIPSIPESALFGTKLADRFFLVNAGGDVGFLNGVFKHIVEQGWEDRMFVDGHSTGFAEASAAVSGQSWEDLERVSGTTRDDMHAFAHMVAEAHTAVFVWSMGVTQHVCGEDNVRSIVNVALSKGFVGRPGCGLMPIRGHSGVQGGAEMGAYSTAFPGNVPVDPASAERLSEQWGFPVPSTRGLTAPEMIDAAHHGALDVLFSSGGNFLEVLPDPDYVDQALARVPLRIHMDIVVSTQMLTDPGEEVLLLPAATRYETPGGVTETSTERRVIFSPEIPGRRIGEARPEWHVFLDLARRVRPDRASLLDAWGTPAIREEISRVVPAYRGIEGLSAAGDQFQYGGPHLCAGWDFPTADGKAHFAQVPLPELRSADGKLRLATRRGKQFNSMVQERTDALNGAGRDAVLISREDADRLGLAQGERVALVSDAGRMEGTVLVSPVAPGNVQVHWPEGNVLLAGHRRSAESGIPDFNALVQVEKLSR